MSEDHKHSHVKELLGFILLISVVYGIMWWTTENENQQARERAHHLEAQ